MSKHIKYKDNNICVDKYYFMSVDGCKVILNTLEDENKLTFENKNISTYIHDVIYEFVYGEKNETLDLDEILMV